MGETVGHHLAAGRPLQGVVTNGVGGLQGGGHVRLFQMQLLA